MNNTIFAFRSTSPLLRTGRSVNGPGTPLICRWQTVETAKRSTDVVTDSAGGLLRCA